ncbi:MAG: hypothetical protein JXA60_11500 [Candidatus Coatesbacteria bacterium]|nr:hypothetical protein [Candidatus Coatesbacteria bacterium]
MRYFSLIIILFSQIYAWELDVSDNILFEQNDGGAFYSEQTNLINVELSMNFKTRKFDFLLRDYTLIGISQNMNTNDIFGVESIE